MPQVIFIRHAEKACDPVHLSDIGRIRAANLPDYLLYPYGEFKVPQQAYIMEIPGHRKSDRCYETMKPTIQQGNLRYVLVERSHTYHLATVVVCWEHSRIIDILNLMGADAVNSWGLDPESGHSGGKCFDATWVCDIDVNAIRLRVYKQFDIIDGYPVYTQPRTKVWYDKIFDLPQKQQMCVIS